MEYVAASLIHDCSTRLYIPGAPYLHTASAQAWEPFLWRSCQAFRFPLRYTSVQDHRWLSKEQCAVLLPLCSICIHGRHVPHWLSVHWEDYLLLSSPSIFVDVQKRPKGWKGPNAQSGRALTWMGEEQGHAAQHTHPIAETSSCEGNMSTSSVKV